MWGLFVSSLDPTLDAALRQIGWDSRVTPGNDREIVVGDYARGFLILHLDAQVQVARRSVRGEPSLKMWTGDFDAAQKYVAFWVGREIRFRQGRPDHSVPVSADSVSAPFRITSTHPLQARIEWGIQPHEWAEFGAGNTFAAVQFSHYARGTVADTLEQILA